jgi:hypothetical protein
MGRDREIVEELREIKLLLSRISLTLDYLWRDVMEIKRSVSSRNN